MALGWVWLRALGRARTMGSIAHLGGEAGDVIFNPEMLVRQVNIADLSLGHSHQASLGVTITIAMCPASVSPDVH